MTAARRRRNLESERAQYDRRVVVPITHRPRVGKHSLQESLPSHLARLLVATNIPTPLHCGLALCTAVDFSAPVVAL
jgi:hypothetical protein